MAEPATTFRMPPHRLVEARRITTESGWPKHCPDRACATGFCAGRMRALGTPWGGKAPTCLSIAIRMVIDRDGCTLREANAYLGFLRPGENWSIGPNPAEFDGWDALALAAGDRPSTPAESLVLVTAIAAGAKG